VRRSSLATAQQTMNASLNFTALTPDTNYMVDINSVSSGCQGFLKTISVTTSTREAGVPRSELALLHTLLSTKVHINFKKILISKKRIRNVKTMYLHKQDEDTGNEFYYI